MDIGGTNARFGLWAAGGPRRVEVLPTARFESFSAAAAHYLRGARPERDVAAAAVCAAGPVEDGQVALTNCAWTLSIGAIAEATGTGAVVLVNDFEALAWALPGLTSADLQRLGGPGSELGTGHALAVLGPGTGLGVAGLVPLRTGGYAAVVGEGGHVTLPARGARESVLVGALAQRYGHISAERVLCGSGIADLYCEIRRVDGQRVEASLGAAEVAARAAGGDPSAREALHLFSGWLGTVAGDLALTLGARGGVYVAGGIVPRLGSSFDTPRFRERFEDKGRFVPYLRRVPTALVVSAYPAFAGLAALARHERIRPSGR